MYRIFSLKHNYTKNTPTSKKKLVLHQNDIRWVRLPDEIDAKVQAKAKKEDRSIAYVLQKIIINHFTNGKKTS
jgi:hypothetical protein